MFSFQMTCMIMNGNGRLEQPILDFFLKGDTSLDDTTEINPVDWLSSTKYANELIFLDNP